MIKRITDLLFGQKLASEQNKKPIDHKKILETCNDVRLQICQKK